MIGAFPDLYPDEMLVSAWARYEAWVCYPNRCALLEELFGYNKAKVTFDIPGRLGYFAATLPPEHSATSVTQLIFEHTLFPYYSAFLPLQRQKKICQQMSREEGVNLHVLLGLHSRDMRLPDRLRYCPICVDEDRTHFGETYWHRSHQAVGVEVCPNHAMWLETSDVAMWMVHGAMTFTPAESVVTALPPRPLNLDVLSEKQLLRLARAVQWLFEHPNVSAETFQLKRRGLLQLATQDLATYSGNMKQREIALAFEQIFPSDMLSRIGCDLDRQAGKSSWLQRTLQNRNRTYFVLYSLLLVLFYAEDIPAYLTLPTELKPFGSGPWTCLNPACACDGERCISICEVDYNSKGLPRGTFTCEVCGFVYSRVGPDTEMKDCDRIGEIKKRGPVWEAKLRDLWFDPDVTIRHMTSVLRSSWGQLRWQGSQLGLPFPPPGVRERRRTGTPIAPCEDIAVDPTLYRDAWLAVVRQYPDLRVKDLRKVASSIHSWLRYHDREWLLKNTPQKTRFQPQGSSVDWEQRDNELVAEIQQAYKDLMSRQQPLFRVGSTAILTAIRRRGYCTRNRHRLPKSLAVLEQLAESHEDFAIRRVWHIAENFHVRGEVPRRRVIAERASVSGPPHRDNQRVQVAIDEALVWLRGE